MTNELLDRDTPDWRYAAAVGELDLVAKGKPIYREHNDTGVEQLKNLIKLRRNKALSPDYIREVTGVAGRLLDWYESYEVGGIKDMLEASVLAKVEKGFYSNYISPLLSDNLVRMYCAFFFDVMDKLDKPFWIERNVFKKYFDMTNRLDRTVRYVWKIVAYHGGESKFIQAVVSGKMFDKETMEWMENFCVSSHVRNAVQIIDNLSKMPDAERAVLTHQSVEGWHRHKAEMAEKYPDDIPAEGKLDANTVNLLRSLNAEQIDGKVPEEREHLQIDKYTDESILE